MQTSALRRVTRYPMIRSIREAQPSRWRGRSTHPWPVVFSGLAAVSTCTTSASGASYRERCCGSKSGPASETSSIAARCRHPSGRTAGEKVPRDVASPPVARVMAQRILVVNGAFVQPRLFAQRPVATFCRQGDVLSVQRSTVSPLVDRRDGQNGASDLSATGGRAGTAVAALWPAMNVATITTW